MVRCHQIVSITRRSHAEDVSCTRRGGKLPADLWNVLRKARCQYVTITQFNNLSVAYKHSPLTTSHAKC